MTRKVSEKTMRSNIAVMRSVFDSDKWHYPYMLEVAKEMEQMLEELLELRKAQKK